ncbi:MAG: Fe-S cluster assembly protein IscX [Anaerolineales bacterium]|jgi:FeS assembly protein IscX
MPTGDQDPQPTPLSPDEDVTLGWENSYEIALTLHRQHPDIDLEEVSLGMIYRWTIDLPNFLDDRELANDQILLAIYQEWLEEVNPI